jgi:hypothetical protein
VTHSSIRRRVILKSRPTIEGRTDGRGRRGLGDTAIGDESCYGLTPYRFLNSSFCALLWGVATG